MQTLNLTGKWKLKRVKNGDTVPALVPGDTHSALLAAGKIADPYDGCNELDVQWIGREDWCYSRTFKVSRAWLSLPSVFLNCDSLDTITEIRINGQLAGNTENQFARYRFEVKPLLKVGENHIEILFLSSEKTAYAIAKTLPYPVPHGNNPVQSMHRNLVRKVQCHSGWDWGPCLMVAGIYGDLSLNACEQGRIEYVYCEQKHAKNRCTVDVICEFEALAAGAATLEVKLGKDEASQPVALVEGLNTVRATVTVKNPRLWWPNGYGEQYLYPLSVRLGGCECRKQIGLRKMEVISEEDKIGRSLIFRVNGVDIFCKGANWIPCDALPQRQTPAHYDELLTSAAQAHMNMIRVWGGGQYETDLFYQLCDAKGLLVWQDFMFACSLYPATPEFLENVRREVRHQMKRLRDYACLAIWCGDNENIGSLNWFEESRKSRDRYLLDYNRLNEGVLSKEAAECDNTRVFWPSSPCGGPGDFSDAFHCDNRGDMHYWGVWHEGKSMDAFYKIIPRFCSEFGYQSFPSLDTIRTYAPESQFNVTTPIMEHHQRNPGGNSRITEMFTRYFRVPEGFANFVYLSQVQQGLVIKTGVEHWRHLRPTCMGTIYWQLNDNWPVCSWASLEYQGKWKLLHYMAKRFYAPTIVSAFQREDGTVEVWLTDDVQKSRQAKVKVQVLDFAGKVMFEEKLTLATPGGGAKLLREYPQKKLTSSPAATFMLLSLEVDGVAFRNEHFFTVYKKCDLPEAKVNTTVKAQGGGFAVTVKATAPAFYVSLNADGLRGEFDDNCFTLLPKETRMLYFTPKQKLTLAEFQKSLLVNHLRQTY